MHNTVTRRLEMPRYKETTDKEKGEITDAAKKVHTPPPPLEGLVLLGG